METTPKKKNQKARPSPKALTQENSTELSAEDTTRGIRAKRMLDLLLSQAPSLPDNTDYGDVVLSYHVTVRIGDEQRSFENIIRLPGLLEPDNQVDAPEMLEGQLDLMTRPVKNMVMGRLRDLNEHGGPVLTIK
jgi:hypothetical protein